MTDPWNPNQLTQKDFTLMTDPIAELQESSETIRINSLTTQVANLQSANQSLLGQITDLKNAKDFLLRKNHSDRRKVSDLLTQLVELESNEVNETLEEAGIALPRKKFAFRVKVNAVITVEAYGRDEDDAWENAEDDLNNINYDDLEDVEAESSPDYTEEIDTEPINLRDFLGS